MPAAPQGAKIREPGHSPGMTMTFAVIKTGGKQYKVAANDVIKIEKLDALPGDVVTFDQVLMVGEGDAVTVGVPLVDGALVAGQFIQTKKNRTVIILKKERRQHFDRRNGHRQQMSTVRITEILVGGAKVTTKPDEIAKARYEAKLAAANATAESLAQKQAAQTPRAAKPAAAKKTKAPAKAAAADKPVAEAKASKAKAEPKTAAAPKAEKPVAAKKPAAKKAAPKTTDKA